MAEPETAEDTKRLEELRQRDDGSVKWCWEMGYALREWQGRQASDRKNLVRLKKKLRKAKGTLYKMVAISKAYPKQRDLPELRRTTLIELLKVKNPKTRSRLAQDAESKGWSPSKLQKEIIRRTGRPPSRNRKPSKIRRSSLVGDLVKVADAVRTLRHRINQLFPERRRAKEREKENSAPLRSLLKSIQTAEACLPEFTQRYETWRRQTQTPK